MIPAVTPTITARGLSMPAVARRPVMLPPTLNVVQFVLARPAHAGRKRQGAQCATPRRSATSTATWRPGLCVDSADSMITPYELRHTAITHQADPGWTSFEIADWVGTSEQMLSERYRQRLRRVS